MNAKLVTLAALLAGTPLIAQAAPRATSHLAGCRAGTDASGLSTVTFAGFQVSRDGTSHVFVDLTAPVDVQPKIDGKTASFKLVGTRLGARNNENTLNTSHFSTGVVSARLVPGGDEKGEHKHGRRHKKKKTGDVVLVVKMREDAQPSHRMTKNADGTARLYVDFPKPKKTPPPEPDPVAPQPKQPSPDEQK